MMGMSDVAGSSRRAFRRAKPSIPGIITSDNTNNKLYYGALVPASPGFKDVFFVVREFAITYHVPITRVGPVHVQLWIDHLGNTSAVYGFRVLSADETVTHAEGRRVQVRLDPSTLRPAVIGPELREACAPLVRATASVGLDARTGCHRDD